MPHARWRRSASFAERAANFALPHEPEQECGGVAFSQGVTSSPQEMRSEIGTTVAPSSHYSPMLKRPTMNLTHRSRCLTTVKAATARSDYSLTTLMKITARIILGTALIAALGLTGCGKSSTGSGASAATIEAPAPGVPASSKPTTGRAVEITANDTMKFSVTEIRAKPGEALAVTLVNQGTMPKFSMGHNWVLLTPEVDVNAFAGDAAMAAKTDYVPASYKDRVVAATKLLGPKESDTVIFNAPTKPGRYPFVCSFPGHFQVGMKGDLIVE
jgi:azurin